MSEKEREYNRLNSINKKANEMLNDGKFSKLTKDELSEIVSISGDVIDILKKEIKLEKK